MRMPPDTKIESIVIGSHQKCHIFCVVPTLGMVPIEFVMGFGRMQMPINGQVFQHIIKGFEVGAARNRAVTDVLSIPKPDRPDWLFFLGDDMIPPWDGFVKLYEETVKNKWDCLTGLYYWKGEPPTPLTWRDDHIGRLIPGVHFTVGDAIHVDLTGLDFTLIRVSLLEEMEAPWFKTGPSLRADMPQAVEPYIDKANSGIVMHTEDTWFYGRAKKVGAKIGVHSGVRVAHFDVRTGCIY
jgi:hypothetical protein